MAGKSKQTATRVAVGILIFCSIAGLAWWQAGRPAWNDLQQWLAGTTPVPAESSSNSDFSAVPQASAEEVLDLPLDREPAELPADITSAEAVPALFEESDDLQSVLALDLIPLTDEEETLSPIVQVADRKPARKTSSSAEPEQRANQPQPLAPNTAAIAVQLSQAETLLTEGDEFGAYQMLSEWYFKYPSERPRFQKMLDDLATRIYFSPQPHIEPPYEIQPGDELRKIAKRYQLSWQYLAKMNNVDPRKIRAGKTLKVFQGPFGAVVDMSDFEITVHLNGHYVRRYRVGLGKNNSTPTGEFAVKEKLENPKYYGSDGEVREADDPKNPLGERWIDLGDSYGIHGTIEPESIGKNESKGCVRMLNDDVAEVYDLLTIGSVVRIQR